MVAKKSYPASRRRWMAHSRYLVLRPFLYLFQIVQSIVQVRLTVPRRLPRPLLAQFFVLRASACTCQSVFLAKKKSVTGCINML